MQFGISCSVGATLSPRLSWRTRISSVSCSHASSSALASSELIQVALSQRMWWISSFCLRVPTSPSRGRSLLGFACFSDGLGCCSQWCNNGSSKVLKRNQFHMHYALKFHTTAAGCRHVIRYRAVRTNRTTAHKAAYLRGL